MSPHTLRRGAGVEARADSVITFGDLLQLEGIDPREVQLVRHTETRFAPGLLLDVWRADRARFDEYQSMQGRLVFDVGGLIASFIVSAVGRTIFVGLYRVEERGFCPPGTVWPFDGADASGAHLYRLVLDERLAEYADRLVIEWGAGTRAWVQRAANQPKPVLEIATQHGEPFPGFRPFVTRLADVPTLPANWQEVLRNVKGVYLLVDRETGEQYVGSAKGTDSLLGRWLAYTVDGHGGNVELRRRGRRDYQVSVLEAIGATSPDETIEQAESFWKNKLLTRRFGLNEN